MNNRTKRAVAAAVALVLLAGAVWFFIFRDTAPEAVSLEGAVDAVTSTTAQQGTSDPPSDSDDLAGPDAQDDPDSLDGTWTIDTTIGGGVVENSSFVGYRVREELATVGAFTAVGRSTGLTGSFSFSGTTLESADIVVDMTQLTSDSSNRDNAMRGQALETSTFPEASFVLTSPVDLTTAPEPGSSFTVEAAGDLTLHGVTRSVTVPIEGQRIEDTVVVVGSIEIVFADYAIDRPRAAVVLSVEDTGVMEFQLFLTRA